MSQPSSCSWGSSSPATSTSLWGSLSEGREARSAVTVQFLCPHCEKAVVRTLPLDPGSQRCDHCGKELPAFPGAESWEGSPLSSCLICSGERFYLQRDFNQRIGCAVAGIGALLSPFTYGLSLVVCLLLDLGLY